MQADLFVRGQVTTVVLCFIVELFLWNGLLQIFGCLELVTHFSIQTN